MPVRAPRANIFTERFVRSVRIECLEWLLIRNERRLERVLIEFVDHYNAARPYRGIDLEIPIAFATPSRFDQTGKISRVDRLGGLVHQHRIAT
jgi:transposase InsO family protein